MYKQLTFLLFIGLLLSACKNTTVTFSDGKRNTTYSPGSRSEAPAPSPNPPYQNANHKFTVTFPSSCNQYKENEHTQANSYGELPAWTYQSNCGGAGVYSVTVVTLPPALRKAAQNAEAQARMLPTFALSFVQPPNIPVKDETLTVHSFPARRVTIKSKDNNGKAMEAQALFVNTGEKVYEVYVGTLPGELDRTYVKGFFDSFQIGSATAAATPVGK